MLPLWILYEALRFSLAPEERNLAEVWIQNDLARVFGPTGDRALRVFFGLTVLVAAWSIARRQLPWLRVAALIALEGAVYALVLGPLADALTESSARVLSPELMEGHPLVRNLIGSLGAGIFEEVVFRLGLLSVLALGSVAAVGAFGLPYSLGVVLAILLSSVAFSLFHHVGPGAPPVEYRVFLFRTMAGVLLGVMFVLRGFGVCVYAHSAYDLHYYLMTH